MGIVQNSLDVVKIAGRIANPELLEEVTSLNEQVLELSSKNVELQQQLFRCEKELQLAKEKLQVIGEVERIADYIYRKGESEPCCPRCFDVDRRLVHIVTTLRIICKQPSTARLANRSSSQPRPNNQKARRNNRELAHRISQHGQNAGS
jgi:hypothetical protein